MKIIAERPETKGSYGGWYTKKDHDNNMFLLSNSDIWDAYLFNTIEEAVDTISKMCDETRDKIKSHSGVGIHSGKHWNFANKNAWIFYSINEKALTLENKIKCSNISNGIDAWLECRRAWLKELELTKINI